MFGFHKPKMYRSMDGCCICRAKSSSSRFTDSTRYEKDFPSCFGLCETRSGDICNACVLLVKRWKKLPLGSKKNWNHVVDARGGSSLKATVRPKKMKSLSRRVRSSQAGGVLKRHREKSPNGEMWGKSRSGTNYRLFIALPRRTTASVTGSESQSDSDAHSTSSASPAQSPSYSNQSDEGSDSELNPGTGQSPIFSFLDLTYWKRQKVCCGVIYKGRFGEVLIHPHLFKPCCQKQQQAHQEQLEERPGEEEEEEEEEEEPQGSKASLQPQGVQSPPKAKEEDDDEEEEEEDEEEEW